MMLARWLISGLVGVCLTTSIAIAQKSAPQNAAYGDKEAVYFRLFSKSMIRNASPEQAARMRKSEAENRERFDTRQQARREQQAAAKQQSEVSAVQSEPRQAQIPTPAAKRGKSKVYKWVDANGRVHFGDAPKGNDAKELTVGGVARIQGTPSAAPTILKKVDNSD
ncbi:MAG: hypothetical protein ACI8W7_001344 [Gammaproteobacteria bacterium]|jgi:hypothetical protein